MNQLKKILFIQLYFCFIGWNGMNVIFANNDTLPSLKKSANDLHQLNYDVTLGYGIGNVWISFLKKNYNTSDYKIVAAGPFTATAEYHFNKKISAGISIAYSKINGSIKRFLVDEQLTIFTAYLRANYHFVHCKKFDAYAGLGGGYVRSVYQNSLGVPSENVPGLFGYTAQLGLKYYFVQHAGIFTELGYVNGSFCLVGFAMRL